MSKLALVLNFAGSLIPYLFPDKEFKPKRLVAVLLIIITLSVCTQFLGLDTTSEVVDLSKDVISLTEN